MISKQESTLISGNLEEDNKVSSPTDTRSPPLSPPQTMRKRTNPLLFPIIDEDAEMARLDHEEVLIHDSILFIC